MSNDDSTIVTKEGVDIFNRLSNSKIYLILLQDFYKWKYMVNRNGIDDIVWLIGINQFSMWHRKLTDKSAIGLHFCRKWKSSIRNCQETLQLNSMERVKTKNAIIVLSLFTVLFHYRWNTCSITWNKKRTWCLAHCFKTNGIQSIWWW